MHRKVVTVLFCDVVGSTALGESVDPEALQGILARYFERMQEIVELHGGTVEKFIGDAVMAVFGVPVVHEDDALRACRAAVEMRAAFPELGVRGRIGVNTGEVVTGTEERLAAGDAVNVAARLQNAADPDEILIGEATLELVRGAVECEALEPLELKGKSERVPAHRLSAVREAPERSHESRFVGRERELATLREAWRRTQDERRCELVTVVGDPGIGKSRLIAEALAGVDSRVIRARCLPYGDGITYWPVVEAIKQLDALPSDPGAASSLRSLLGESEEATSAEAIGWAFRKLLEEHAPLVVVFDDIQWGEETFLDLIEGLALLASGSLLIVCMARPELVERRASWPVTLRLEPLSHDEVGEIVGELAEGLGDRIAAAAGGNPLFLTEMLAMAGEGGDVEVPPTLRALLAARLDRLDEPDRRVLERGAVEGEVFHRGAVQALTPEETQVTPRLAALTRKQLIRPDTALLAGDDGFRFRHLLIRDSAYEALPKSTRAELHERFAAWLEARGRDLVEHDEIAGYHLEQAARYRRELGESADDLAAQAGARLAAAGRRALWREDFVAAIGLIERALAIDPPTGKDVSLELDLVEAHAARFDFPLAAEVATAAAERARSAGNERGALVARVKAEQHRLPQASDADPDDLERLARQALEILESAGDHAALVHVWDALQDVANFRARMADYADASEQALRHAELAGQHRATMFWLDAALVHGPRPADEALAILDALPAEIRHPRRSIARASLLAMLGQFDEARPLAAEAAERMRGFLGVDDDAIGRAGQADVELYAGEWGAAVVHLERGCDILESQGRLAELSFFAPLFSRILWRLCRHEEAEALALKGRELAPEADVASQTAWRQALALTESSHGRHEEALGLAREAIEITETTDALTWQGTVYLDLGEVLAAAGSVDEAAEAFAEAVARFERKQNLAMAGQAMARLDALRASVTA